jgi:hypothetical protein
MGLALARDRTADSITLPSGTFGTPMPKALAISGRLIRRYSSAICRWCFSGARKPSSRSRDHGPRSQSGRPLSRASPRPGGHGSDPPKDIPGTFDKPGLQCCERADGAISRSLPSCGPCFFNETHAILPTDSGQQLLGQRPQLPRQQRIPRQKPRPGPPVQRAKASLRATARPSRTAVHAIDTAQAPGCQAAGRPSRRSRIPA